MLTDSSLEFAHVGFAIGRAAGPAVERNRVRRRLREILRTVDLSPGLYLFGLATPARDTTFDVLQRGIQEIVSRVSAPRTLSAGS
jgi:ribonuclease P protein component